MKYEKKNKKTLPNEYVHCVQASKCKKETVFMRDVYIYVYVSIVLLLV